MCQKCPLRRPRAKRDEMTTLVQLPLLQTHPFVPPPELTALASTGAIHRIHTEVGDEAWLITGYPIPDHATRCRPRDADCRFPFVVARAGAVAGLLVIS